MDPQQQQLQAPLVQQQPPQEPTTVKQISAPLTIADFMDTDDGYEIPTIQVSERIFNVMFWL